MTVWLRIPAASLWGNNWVRSWVGAEPVWALWSFKISLSIPLRPILILYSNQRPGRPSKYSLYNFRQTLIYIYIYEFITSPMRAILSANLFHWYWIILIIISLVRSTNYNFLNFFSILLIHFSYAEYVLQNPVLRQTQCQVLPLIYDKRRAR